MANTDNPHGFRPVTCIGGMTGVMPTWQAKLKSNHIVAYGDAVYATAGYAVNSATGDKAVLGVCAEAGLVTSSATNPDFLFYPAHDSIVFSGQTSGAMTQAKIWTLVDIEGTAGGGADKATRPISDQEVNEDATSNKNVYLVGLKQGGNTSLGTWTDVLFLWCKSKFQARGAMVLSTVYIGY